MRSRPRRAAPSPRAARRGGRATWWTRTATIFACCSHARRARPSCARAPPRPRFARRADGVAISLSRARRSGCSRGRRRSRRSCARRAGRDELVRRVRLVGGDEPLVEPGDAVRTRRAGTPSRSRLHLEERVQLVQLQLAQLELVLERASRSETSPTSLLEPADPRRRRRRSRSGARPPSPSPPATRPCSVAIRASTDCFLSTMSAPAGAAATSTTTRPIARRRMPPGFGGGADRPCPRVTSCRRAARARGRSPGRAARAATGSRLRDDHRPGRVGRHRRRLGNRHRARRPRSRRSSRRARCDPLVHPLVRSGARSAVRRRDRRVELGQPVPRTRSASRVAPRGPPAPARAGSSDRSRLEGSGMPLDAAAAASCAST